MKTHLRASLALIALTMAAFALAACAQSEGPQSAPVTQQEANVSPPPPPPPPPPPEANATDQAVVTGSRMHRGELASPMAGGFTGGTYAQMAPQPMPGSVDRENYQHEDVNPIHEAATDPVSTFSIDVDTASYSNVRRFLTAGQLPPHDAVRIEELVNYFDYNYPLPQNRTQPFSTTVAMAPAPWSRGHTLLHIGLQGLHAR
jgi:Ca-activated chloride channel family protein